jgi:beta-glucosidase-like glycosyl hydrolase
MWGYSRTYAVLLCLGLLLGLPCQAYSELSCPKEKIEQMLIVQYYFGLPSYNEAQIATIKEHPNLGGVIFYGHEKDGKTRLQMKNDFIETINGLQSLLKVPGFMVVDYEDAKSVRRLVGMGLRDLPTPAQISNLHKRENSKNILRAIGQVRGRELERLGINWNLAPVADTRTGEMTRPSHLAREGRMLGTDPAETAEIIPSLIEGVQQSHVIATAKHFPNLGDAPVDTHEDYAVFGKSWEEAIKSDLVPFISAFQANVHSVLVGYAKWPCLDSIEPRVPLSDKILPRIRNDLDYEGLIITEPIMMGKIEGDEVFETAEAVRVEKAILAGADVIPVWDPKKVLTRICDTITGDDHVKAERLIARINESYDRILLEKKRLELIPIRQEIRQVSVQEEKKVFGPTRVDLQSGSSLETALQSAPDEIDYLTIALLPDRFKRPLKKHERDYLAWFDRIYSGEAPDRILSEARDCLGWKKLWGRLGGGDPMTGLDHWQKAFMRGEKVDFPKASDIYSCQ